MSRSICTAKSFSDIDSLGGTVSLDAPRIVAAGFAADRVNAKARIDGRRVAIDGRASAYGATATTAGSARVARGIIGSGGVRSCAVRLGTSTCGVCHASLNVPAAATDVNGDYHVAGTQVRSNVGSGSTWTGSNVGSGFSRIAGDLRFAPSTIAGAAIARGSTAGFTIDGGEFAYEADATVADLDLQRVGTGIPRAGAGRPTATRAPSTATSSRAAAGQYRLDRPDHRARRDEPDGERHAARHGDHGRADSAAGVRCRPAAGHGAREGERLVRRLRSGGRQRQAGA